MKCPRIVEIPETKFAGMRISMSFTKDRTGELWCGFRLRVNEVHGRIGTDTFSLKVFAAGYSFCNFDPAAQFDKWAAVEVHDTGKLPDGFEGLTIPTGKYAMFIHMGTAAESPRTFGHIFGSWLPNSDFELDHRPHFEVFEEGYSPFDPEAEEEVWIPIRPHQQ